ncbi:MAG: hypothetical protein FWH11_08480 [Micrococcales bacterium]|nr:hypothetical protein [Micrococcales bacterium]
MTLDNEDEHQVLSVRGKLYFGQGSSRRRIPTGFVVQALSVDGGRVGLHSTDGRAVWATPEQLSSYRSLIPREHNAEYDEQELAEFIDVGNVPARDAQEVPIDDPRLGRIVFDGGTWVSSNVGTPLGSGHVWFGDRSGNGGFSRARVTKLLPTVHTILDRLPEVADRATRFLWEWGDEWPVDEETFRENFNFDGGLIHMYHSGDFILGLSDYLGIFEEYFLDGYWPEIHCRTDGTPVQVTIEA